MLKCVGVNVDNKR